MVKEASPGWLGERTERKYSPPFNKKVVGSVEGGGGEKKKKEVHWHLSNAQCCN